MLKVFERKISEREGGNEMKNFEIPTVHDSHWILHNMIHLGSVWTRVGPLKDFLQFQIVLKGVQELLLLVELYDERSKCINAMCACEYDEKNHVAKKES